MHMPAESTSSCPSGQAVYGDGRVTEMNILRQQFATTHVTKHATHASSQVKQALQEARTPPLLSPL